VDHQLENLGPERFQQLAQALLVLEFPNMRCFPVGQPDGGRDAVRALPSDDKEERLVVFQVKFSRNPAAIPDVRKWLFEKAADESSKVQRLIERGASQYVLITNVPGTAHLDVGSIDKLLADLRTEVGIPVQCWWRDDINRRLDGNWNIKLRYSEVLSGHDFFRLLLSTTAGERHERRFNAIRAFIVDQYEEDVEVKFKQVELHNKLLDLFIDLPFRVVIRSRIPFHDFHIRDLTIHTFQETANTIVATNSYGEEGVAGTATLLLSDYASSFLNQVVIEGAPGQGKSTLAQYLCQVHRIRILSKTDEVQKLLEEDKRSELCVPFKVDLRDLASWLSGTDPFIGANEIHNAPEHRSLEAFLARLVRHHSGGITFDANDLLEVSRILPLLVVLDGLDEVWPAAGSVDTRLS
jgi:hypothetical protein